MLLRPSRVAHGDRPLGPVALNRASPMMRGLLWAFHFTRGGAVVFDVAGRVACTMTAGFIPTWYGDGIYCGGGLDGPTLDTSQAFTIATWYRLPDTGSFNRRVVQFTTDNWLIGPYGGAYQVYNGSGFISGPSLLAAPVMQLVTDDKTTTTSYVNGRSVGTLGSIALASTNVIGLGSSGRFSEPPAAVIQDVMAWQRVLTTAEIWQLYDPATRWDLYWQPSSRVFFDIGGAAAPSDTQEWRGCFPVSRPNTSTPTVMY